MNPATVGQIINLITAALVDKVRIEIDIHIRVGAKPEKEETK